MDVEERDPAVGSVRTDREPSEPLELVPPDPDEDTPTVLGVPLNRIVAFLGPYIALFAGGVASVVLNALHITFVAHDQLANGIATTVTFLVSSGLVWLGQQQWLKGHHIVLQGQADVAIVRAQAEPLDELPPSRPPPVSARGGHPDGDEYDAEAAHAQLDRRDADAVVDHLVSDLTRAGLLSGQPITEEDLPPGFMDPITEEELAASPEARVRPTPEVPDA